MPWLIVGACVLLGLQPRLTAALRERRRGGATASRPPWCLAVVAGAAYASYFGAAAGVLLLAILALGIIDRLQRLNALNRFLVLLANAIAVPALLLVAPVELAVGRGARAGHAGRRGRRAPGWRAASPTACCAPR